MNNKTKADILKYKANLEITPDSYIEYYDDSENFYYSDKDKRVDGISQTLDAFISHKPSETVDILDESINIYSGAIKNIKENINHKNINDYLSAENETVLKDILDKNYNDLYGSTALESLVEMEEIHSFLSNVKKDYIFLTYGKDVDLKTCKEIDDSYIDYLVDREKEGDLCKVNYFMIYYDTETSILIKELVTSLIRLLIDLSSIEDNLDNVAVEEKHLTVIKEGFKINNLKIDKDLSKEKGVLKNFINYERKIFLEKEKCNFYNNTFGELYSLEESIDLINEIKIDTTQVLNELMSDLLRISLYIDMCKGDICKKLLKKQSFRNFFKN